MQKEARPVLALVLLFKLTLATSNANLGGRPGSALLSLLMDPYRWRVMVVQKVSCLSGHLPVPWTFPKGALASTAQSAR